MLVRWEADVADQVVAKGGPVEDAGVMMVLAGGAWGVGELPNSICALCVASVGSGISTRMKNPFKARFPMIITATRTKCF